MCAHVKASLILAKIIFKVVAYFNQVTNYEYVVNNPFKRPFSGNLGHRFPKKKRNTLQSLLCHVHFWGFLPLHSLANKRWTMDMEEN
jgi:hypothetical protein